MNLVTHVLIGWSLAETVPSLGRREKALVTFAAVAPDLDGLGVFAELATRNSRDPLLWWTDYHHLLGHNLLFALLASALAVAFARGHRKLTAALVFIAVHSHILGDLAGSRGPDEYQWPIPYLYPFSTDLQLTWSGQWYLNAWPNIALTGMLIALAMVLAWRRGYSIVSLFSTRGDRLFINAMWVRFGLPPAPPLHSRRA